ncbi:MAG: S41 family peptidase [Planctomycetota bacterium]|nr:S41 family peptidase [Planctomycetota bacterium]
MTPLLKLSALLLALASLASLATGATQDHDLQASPFDALRWVPAGEHEAPEVQVAGSWYRPVEVAGVPVTDLLAAIDAQWPGQRQKRFAEDLMEVLFDLGAETGATLDLVVVPLEGPRAGEQLTLTGIANTEAKRRALKGSSRGGPRRPLPRPAPPSVSLEGSALDVELDAFRTGLEQRFAYLHLGGIDLDAALAELKAELLAMSVGGRVASGQLAVALDRLLKTFGDGHASVSGPPIPEHESDGRAAFLVADCDAGTVAFHRDRSGLLDSQHPFLVAIDGLPLDAWVLQASTRVTAGSSQLVRRRSLRELRDLDGLRRELGLEARLGKPATLTLQGSDGLLELELPLHDPSQGVGGPLPGAIDEDFDFELLELPTGTVASLRIGSMDSDRDAWLHASMARAKDSDALIVDVRGNGGGSRALLLALGGYLAPEGGQPWVANVAAFRLAPGFDEDHLEARYMHRADWPGWSAPQRAVVEAAAKAFHPEWPLPTTPGGPLFSAWHYLVVGPTGHPAEYLYDKPVVILADAGCFSATDIFLAAFADRPVGPAALTLVGQASSGGSARTQSFHLPLTGIEVRCASMASFRLDGRLYDGRGVEVEVEVLPGITDVLDGPGRPDRQLETALEILGAQLEPRPR